MKKVTAPPLPRSNENEWARGCAKCKYGIASAPELTRACELHLERLVQMLAGEITFCECQAGIRYHVFLRNRHRKLIEEARRDPRMQAYAAKLTHPDIEVAKSNISVSYAMAQFSPTVHFETESAA